MKFCCFYLIITQDILMNLHLCFFQHASHLITLTNITINSYLNQHSCSIRVEKNFDLNYFSKKPVSKRKKNACIGKILEISVKWKLMIITITMITASSVNVCNVSTTVNMTFIDYVVHSNHNASFEQFVRETSSIL